MEFAVDEVEAEARATQFLNLDPFPSIVPALLSSAEIEDYARITAMIHPFAKKDLKSASYSISAIKRQIIWDENDKYKVTELNGEKDYEFPANSISFIQLQHKLRLPHYIAARFNLTITHVHRGLLLGTGPLIDPGFAGQLLIPIHNLTSAPYRLKADEPLIWLEFTKTTWVQGPPKVGQLDDDNNLVFHRRGTFTPFSEDKKNRDYRVYLDRANRLNPIRSSIPTMAAKAETAANRATSTINFVQWAGGLAFAGLLFALVSAYLQTHSIVQDAHSLSISAREALSTLR